SQPQRGRRQAMRPRPAVERHPLIEPVAALKYPSDVRLEKANDVRTAEVSPQRPQRRSGHDGVANPVGDENGDIHHGSNRLAAPCGTARGASAPPRGRPQTVWGAGRWRGTLAVENPSCSAARSPPPPRPSTNSAPSTSLLR